MRKASAKLRQLMRTSLTTSLALACLQGCTPTKLANEKDAKPSALSSAQPKCEPFEVFIKTPEGGNLVTGVTISRDGDGYLDTRWATTLPAGTGAQIYLHSESRKHAEGGPLLDGAGDKKTSCDGKFITHLSKFSNKGSGFNR